MTSPSGLPYIAVRREPRSFSQSAPWFCPSHTPGSSAPVNHRSRDVHTQAVVQHPHPRHVLLAVDIGNNEAGEWRYVHLYKLELHDGILLILLMIYVDQNLLPHAGRY